MTRYDMHYKKKDLQFVRETIKWGEEIEKAFSDFLEPKGNNLWKNLVRRSGLVQGLKGRFDVHSMLTSEVVENKTKQNNKTKHWPWQDQTSISWYLRMGQRKRIPSRRWKQRKSLKMYDWFGYLLGGAGKGEGSEMTFTESQLECKVLERRGPACLLSNVSPVPNIGPDTQVTLTKYLLLEGQTWHKTHYIMGTQ